MTYDMLVIGAGLYGATWAHQATKAGYKCLVIDKRPHIAGNCYTKQVQGITCCKYGGHIFHTNSRRIWDFVTGLVPFRPYTHFVMAESRRRLCSLPLNMHTFRQLWGYTDPDEAKRMISSVRIPIKKPANLEEWCLSQVGEELYSRFFHHYTAKQWGRDPKDLPASIIRRLPIRFTWDSRWFDDEFQGVPVGGYTALVEKMLDGVEVHLNEPYELGKYDARHTIYTGCIDEYYDYRLGKLEYRSLKHADVLYSNLSDKFGCGTVNYCDSEQDYTRDIEHKHFWGEKSPHTVVTREWPSDTGEPYYPIPTERNALLYVQYKALGMLTPNIIFGGRLGSYQYLNMDQCVASALATWDQPR